MSSKLQAPSSKLQAISSELQAPSYQLQAISSKLSAPSYQLRSPIYQYRTEAETEKTLLLKSDPATFDALFW